jgi:hypothetical protein
MSDDVRRRVDERWDELGIGAVPGADRPAAAGARGRRGLFSRRGS